MSETTRTGGNPVIGAIAGVLAGAVIVGGAFALFQPGADQPASAATPGKNTDVVTVTQSPTVVQPPASASPSPTAEDGIVTEDGVVIDLPKDSYVAIIRTMTKKNYSAEEAVEFAESAAKGGRTPVPIDTDEVNGFNRRGAYAIGVPGLESNQEVTEACRDMGLPRGDNCYARRIK